MKEKIKKILANREVINYMLIVLVALILSIPILNPKLDVYFDDGIQHVARAYGTLESIKEQGLYPNVISEFTNGFGYSWNLFYGPLSSLGIILFSFLCNSFVVSYKLFAFVCLIFSGIFMYKFMINITKNSNTSLLTGIIYLTFPYHLTDWYIRNALGEFMSFMFVPLVFLGLYNLLKTTEKNYYLAIGAIGLILTHNLSTLITAVFSLIYLIVNFKCLKETRVKKGLIINIIFILLVTSFFWAPMIETKFKADYQVYEKDAMSTKESVTGQALEFKRLFATGNDDIYVFELGPHIIIMLVFSIMTVKRLRDEIKKEYIFALVAGLICVWMSTKYFPWKLMPNFMMIIQFPWRMLSIAGFFLSIVCSINMTAVIKNFNAKDSIIISCICIVYVVALAGFIPYSNDISEIENYTLGRMSGKTVEVVAGTAKAEYLPKKAFENRFYIATRENATYVLTGKAIIENEEKDGTSYKAKIKTVEEETVLELPYIYYPGYEVRTDGMIVDNYETENGFLGITLDKNEEIELEVNYKGTNIMRISTLISIISFIVLGIYVWKKH